MKKNWNGKAYKNHLWSCATATTVPEFERAMLALKEFNKDCYKYLADIPPSQWARSHFTGRAVTDILLNNMCEVLNRWLVDARDKPIIIALEYVREYLMKRIVNVLGKCKNSDQLLTPYATKQFEVIKKEASKLTVLWSGSQQYQVNGPYGEQVVVDFGNRECACRKWEIIGIPCKHVVAALYNLNANDDQVGPPDEVGAPEHWVHSVYKIDTWKNTYTFTINPINGRSMWPKSNVPYTLMPPKKIVRAGRPKKNRRKGLQEKDNISKDGRLSKKGISMQCSNCKEFGHNKRGCTNGGTSGTGKKRTRNASTSGTSKKKSKK
ncbi:uncharacterized protein [Rutidosis leptorrhynchoides]|uniref:uncharacterized protein n=1 Tax=Rutidosis leptorrhynchoides TaxID=125765 RepID=UPI003A98D11A